MMDPWAKARGAVLREFEAYAAKLLEAQASRRSVMLVVAQYWNDGADDEVHARVIVSARDTPVWPHGCDWNSQADGSIVALQGEQCDLCADLQDRYFSLYGTGEDVVPIVELFCREGSNQHMDRDEAYVPYAIARRGADGVELELVAVPQRPANVVIGTSDAAHEPWGDARSRALFEEICRVPGDDGPRAVLSDLLVAARPDDPRGEAIALSLVGAPDTATRVRRDELIAAHIVEWIHPLGAVIPPGCAHFERGFLAGAIVYARDAAAQELVQGASAWGTVEVLRLSPGSLDVLDPAMVALRDVGPLGEDGVSRLCEAAEPWAIERLHVVIDGAAAQDIVGPLARTTTLPRLRELVLGMPENEVADALTALARAPWWSQLAQLTLVVGMLAPLARWAALRPAHARLGVTLASDDRQPGGWQVQFCPDDTVEIAMNGWHREGAMRRLVEIVQDLPDSAAIRLRSTPYRTCGDDEVAWLREHAGRDVAID